MPPCFCYFNPQCPSISRFISDQPLLSLLETSCRTIRDLRKIHAQMIKTGLVRDTVAISRVLSFCATGPEQDLGYALSLFYRIERKNEFIWNTVIRGFCGSCDPHVAVMLFVEMLERGEVEPGRLTYPSVFRAYSQLGAATDGGQLHGRIVKLGLEFDPFIRNSVIHMYANCGSVTDAKKLFDEDEDNDVVAWNAVIMGLAKTGDVEKSWRLFCKLPEKNEVSWNTMVSSFVRNGRWNEALDLFIEMQVQGMKPSEFTLVSTLNACAKLGALEQGEWIHDYIGKMGLPLNVFLVTALIDMYSRCGKIEMARFVFDTAPCLSLSCWNSMVFGLATNGLEDEAFKLFLELQSSCFEPDDVSFIAVLTACSHSGRVNEARHYFKMMKEGYGIDPTIQHYGCMVDVLSKVGLLEEAMELISNMDVRPDAAIWGSLLSACIRYQNTELAELIAQNLVSSGQDDKSTHILLSNCYAASGCFEKAVEERKKMKIKQVVKQIGCSAIEVNGEIHEFVAGGK